MDRRTDAGCARTHSCARARARARPYVSACTQECVRTWRAHAVRTTVRGVGIHAHFGRRLLGTTSRLLPLCTRHDAEERRMSEFSGPANERTDGRIDVRRGTSDRDKWIVRSILLFVARNEFSTTREFFFCFTSFNFFCSTAFCV